jgi:hypothetical protein
MATHLHDAVRHDAVLVSHDLPSLQVSKPSQIKRLISSANNSKIPPSQSNALSQLQNDRMSAVVSKSIVNKFWL